MPLHRILRRRLTAPMLLVEIGMVHVPRDQTDALDFARKQNQAMERLSLLNDGEDPATSLRKA